MVFIGAALIATGLMLNVMKQVTEGKPTRVEGGGVVMIGPIPIVFGTSKEIAWYMLLAAIALTVLLITLTLLLRKSLLP